VANILVVDDAAFMRLMIKDMLVEAGHTVIGEAVNGYDAIDKYRALKPDLVTMDITMPDMEGVDALKEIRRIDPHAVVIMCSAMGQKQLIVEAIKSGAKDFIVKPLQSARVIEAISKALVAVR